VPVDGLESPWRLAQVVYVYDSARHRPESCRARSTRCSTGRAQSRPADPSDVRNFLGATFLKQALYELAPTRRAAEPATDATFAATTAPLWAWYDACGRPCGAPAGVPRERSGAAPAAERRRDRHADRVQSVRGGDRHRQQAAAADARVFGMANGTIGNTSFVAIPYNAAHKEGAMVVANFLLDPSRRHASRTRPCSATPACSTSQADRAERALFAPKAGVVGLPAPGEIGRVLLEPHASWMTRITESGRSAIRADGGVGSARAAADDRAVSGAGRSRLDRHRAAGLRRAAGDRRACACNVKLGHFRTMPGV
jgi:putative thiamine transport system substrate-binding protein